MSRKGLTWEQLKVGMRVVCISEAFTGIDYFIDHHDVYKQCGTIREMSDNMSVFPCRKFYITWNDPFFNTVIRGKEYWDAPSMFAEATPEDEMRAKEEAKKYEEQIRKMKDQKRRIEHAMRYL